MALETDYRETRIIYDEGRNMFRCMIGGHWKEYKSLILAKKAIDYASKKGFERVPFIGKKGAWGQGVWSKGTVTSINASGEVWVVWENGDREKLWKSGGGRLYLDEPGNERIIEKIKKLEASVEEARGKIEDLTENLTPALQEEE